VIVTMDGRIGLVGLGVMGRNLALNLARHGFAVSAYDLDAGRLAAAAAAFAGSTAAAADSLEGVVRALERPRRILLMVPAGAPVDAVLGDLRPLLASGDVVVDGGNSFFRDTERRGRELQPSGIMYLGAGISGGEAGALAGPAIMPGGPREAYALVEGALTGIAARSEHGPCCAWIGPGGAGHFVKMVHNGIEYGVMQLICEAYDVLRATLDAGSGELAAIYADWSAGELSSYLMEITATVLARVDDETGRPLVELILDTAGQKGTGKWTSQTALDLGVATPTINAAVEARILSALKDERVAASRALRLDLPSWSGDRDRLVDDIRDGLRLAILGSYAQGFVLLREASKEYGWGLDLHEIARIWTGGCIIRSRLLEDVMAALRDDRELSNLLVSPVFVGAVGALQAGLRRTVTTAVSIGVSCQSLSASLGYLDAYRSERLPANLLQAQRDLFGAHTYQRVDRARGERFHTEW
jgi:6-phosphogluconate dehydrogenase